MKITRPTCPAVRRLTGRPRAAAMLAVAAALLVAGCGTASSSASSTPTATATATTTTNTDLLGNVPTSAAASQTSSAITVQPQEDVFNILSPWNTTVSDSPVQPGSARMIDQAKIRVSFDANGKRRTTTVQDGVYINTRAWTVPVVADGVPTILTCRQVQCGDGGPDITLNIPTNVSPDPLYDGWFTIFDESTQKAYDLWRARREDDGTISYHFMREWSLDGPGFARPYVVSARGSGLPLFAGLIRPGELEHGQINHALAISLPGPAKSYFVQPASSTDGNGAAGSIPEGARIRLSKDFQLARPIDTKAPFKPLPFNAAQQRYAEVIIRALQTYGAIVVDRSAVPTLYFQRSDDTTSNTTTHNPLGVVADNSRYDPRALLQGYELQNLKLDDFSVVSFTSQQRFDYPPRNQSVDPTTLAAAAVGSTGTNASSGTDSTVAGQ